MNRQRSEKDQSILEPCCFNSPGVKVSKEMRWIERQRHGYMLMTKTSVLVVSVCLLLSGLNLRLQELSGLHKMRLLIELRCLLFLRLRFLGTFFRLKIK